MNLLLTFFGLFGATFAISGGSDDGASTDSELDTSEASRAVVGTTDHDHDMSTHDITDDGSNSPENYIDITAFGEHHTSSSHTYESSLQGGRTAITTEAQVAYNGLRDFLGLEPVELETVGQWAFDNDLTNNDMPYGQDLQAVGLFYSMQGAKVAWIDEDAFDPQILADIQRTARLGETDEVMDMVEAFGHDGFATFLETEGLVETFINTLKMEPHYGGTLHGRAFGDLEFVPEPNGVYGTPAASDLNHLTVLSHDQTRPYMNDTFDWPQWPALDASDADVINYFQSMAVLGDPKGEGLTPEHLEAGSNAMSAGESLMAHLATHSVLEDMQPMAVEMEDTFVAL
ncbi:hypothetical protein N9L47_08100 [Rhodobacteraceae bacterium]|nr:hypothetical protein [Paracoccaceae bacterium]